MAVRIVDADSVNFVFLSASVILIAQFGKEDVNVENRIVEIKSAPASNTMKSVIHHSVIPVLQKKNLIATIIRFSISEASLCVWVVQLLLEQG